MFDSVDLERQLPLAGLRVSHRNMTVRPNYDFGYTMLQISDRVASDLVADISGTVEKALGIALPNVGKWALNEDQTVTALCTKPNCWLFFSVHTAVPEVIANLERIVADISAVVTLMCDQYVCLDIGGVEARALLAKGCALDFADEVFAADQVASTLLARTDIMIWRIGPEYRCLLDVSYSDFLWAWLEEATLEFS